MNRDSLMQVSPDALSNLDVRPRATLRVAASKLPGFVTFFTDSDDLDQFSAAILGVHPIFEGPEPPLTFVLLRYRREPDNQLTVFLPSHIDTDAAVTAAVERVVAALELPPAIAELLPVDALVGHGSREG